jgi:fructuronate reductase
MELRLLNGSHSALAYLGYLAERERLADGATCEHVALAVAAWMRYVTGVDEHDALIDVRDLLASRLAAVARGAGTDVDAIVHGYLAVREVFGDDLPHAQPFVRSVSRWLRGLYEHGAHATLEAAYGGAKKR